MKIELKPIGEVKSCFKNPQDLHFACEKGRLADTESRILIDKDFAEGLEGLEEFSHIWVIYHLHNANRIELTTYPGPPNIKNLTNVGVFASRSQHRPNHLALRMAGLIKINGMEMTVSGLDAIDGSPVLDIKPYIPFFDRAEIVRLAKFYEWTEGRA